MTKTALITGASSGIGYAAAIEFHKNGYKVFAGARRLEPMAALKELGIITFQLDISSLELIKAAKVFLVSNGVTKLDVLYNNAGQSCTFPAIDVTDEAMRKCFDVNFFGAINVTREFSDLVINAKGAFGFTGSISAYLPFPWSSVYNASKAALHLYTASLKLEMKPFDVRVVTFATGGVRTSIEDTRPLAEGSSYNVPEMKGTDGAFALRQLMARRNNPMAPEEYARITFRDLESGNGKYFRGAQSSFLYWISHIVPIGLIEFIFIKKFKLASVFDAVKKKQNAQ